MSTPSGLPPGVPSATAHPRQRAAAKFGVAAIFRRRYSAAADYPEVARSAIREMVRQTGPAVLDENGLLKRGVLIRHFDKPGIDAYTRITIGTKEQMDTLLRNVREILEG